MHLQVEDPARPTAKPLWPTCPFCLEPMCERRRGAYHLAYTSKSVLQLAEATPENAAWLLAQHDRLGHFHTSTQRRAVIETAKRVAAALPHLAVLPRNLAKLPEVERLHRTERVHPDYGQPSEERAIPSAVGGAAAAPAEQKAETPKETAVTVARESNTQDGDERKSEAAG
jgi:hypothetical protein